MRSVKIATVAALIGALSLLTGCAPVGGGSPMGGRDRNHGTPSNGHCDPNGVKIFQPANCR